MYSAESLYGSTPQAPSFAPTTPAAPTQRMASSDVKGGWRALVDPHNPLVWLGGVLVVTMGLAGVAGSVRLGRAQLSASIGEAK